MYNNYFYNRKIVYISAWLFLLISTAVYAQEVVKVRDPEWKVDLYENSIDESNRKTTYYISENKFEEEFGSSTTYYRGVYMPNLYSEFKLPPKPGQVASFYTIDIRADDAFRLYVGNDDQGYTMVKERWGGWPGDDVGLKYVRILLNLTATSGIKIQHHNKTKGIANLYSGGLLPIKPEVNPCIREGKYISANVPPSSSYPSNIGIINEAYMNEKYKWEIEGTSMYNQESTDYKDYEIPMAMRVDGHSFKIRLVKTITKKIPSSSPETHVSEWKSFIYYNTISNEEVLNGDEQKICLGEEINFSVKINQGATPYTVEFFYAIDNTIPIPPAHVGAIGSLTPRAEEKIIKTATINNVGEQVSVNHTPTQVGIYNYSVEIRDRNGCLVKTLPAKKVIITNNKPTITDTPDISLCIPLVQNASYQSNNLVIEKQGYELKNGDTALDVVVNWTDCCGPSNPSSSSNLKWQIIGKTTEQSGQPSTTTSTILLDNTTNTDKEYSVKYWLECNGKKYSEVTRKVTIKSRPSI